MIRRLAALLIGLSLMLAEPVKAQDQAPFAVLGAADAPVVLTEFTSPMVPRAVDFQINVFPAFKARYIDTGLVRLEVRERLTGQASVAAASFLVARCAGPGNRLAVLDRVFHDQPDMVGDGTVSRAKDVLQKIAQDFGLDEREFDRCISDTNELKALIDRDEAAAAFGAEFTPSFLINGALYRGEPTLAGLSAAVDKALP